MRKSRVTEPQVWTVIGDGGGVLGMMAIVSTSFVRVLRTELGALRGSWTPGSRSWRPIRGDGRTVRGRRRAVRGGGRGSTRRTRGSRRSTPARARAARGRDRPRRSGHHQSGAGPGLTASGPLAGPIAPAGARSAGRSRRAGPGCGSEDDPRVVRREVVLRPSTTCSRRAEQEHRDADDRRGFIRNEVWRGEASNATSRDRTRPGQLVLERAVLPADGQAANSPKNRWRTSCRRSRR